MIYLNEIKHVFNKFPPFKQYTKTTKFLNRGNETISYYKIQRKDKLVMGK